jgi:predicted dienelactone hydrolase
VSKSSETGFRVQPLTHDERIKAAVIADPPGFFFGADSFAAVKTPVQLWAYGASEGAVTPEGVAAVDKSLPAQHEYHVVPNTANHAFAPPCPPAAAKAKPERCIDPQGFDRAAFHKQFNADVLAFFRRI